MRHAVRLGAFTVTATAIALLAITAAARGPSGYTVVGWNNLGMHCMDADYSVFSILPPYNVLNAQVVGPDGAVVTNDTSVHLTYQAVADPSGSINTTSNHKTNFWQFALPLYGAGPPSDVGLAGAKMPGVQNTPQPMTFDPTNHWFVADGVPITAYDDAGHKNAYPMMRVIARDNAGVELARTDVVLPVSDEMDCSACHASDSVAAARPSGGWAHHPDKQIDYRENILLLHDDFEGGRPSFQAALQSAGYNQAGLWATYHNDGTPILCARCHASNALPGTGLTGIPQLTHSMHSAHATVVDPKTGLTLGNSANRSACYRCHPGSETRCLRGAMGKAVALDGTLAMQCQSCHGTMAQVGSIARTGWLDQPRCGNCHTGDALSNGGQIRFASAIDASGTRRAATLPLFDTNNAAPATGFSLYRFSFGHGGLACEACHGATHAEYVSSHVNDNVQSNQLQGHSGVIGECTACHDRMPNTISGGPHGLHPLGAAWVDAHPDAVENGGSGRCRACHGNDYKGTVLSRTVAARTFSTEFGKRNFFAGAQISCFACHNGPNSESATTNHAPKATDRTLTTRPDTPQSLDLTATDADRNALVFRIVSQPAHGTVGLSGKRATYYPESKYQGADSFTFAAWDGKIDSNLATTSIAVQANNCTLTCSSNAATTGAEGANLSFSASATASGCNGATSFAWLFGDGASAATANTTHAYAFSGTYAWTMTATADGTTCRRDGSIVIDALAPSITRVVTLRSPFRLRLEGSNIHSTVEIRIAGAPYANVAWRNSNSITLKQGRPLSSLFPADTWIPIQLTNPDDGRSLTIEYNRTLRQFR